MDPIFVDSGQHMTQATVVTFVVVVAVTALGLFTPFLANSAESAAAESNSRGCASLLLGTVVAALVAGIAIAMWGAAKGLL